MSLRGQPDKGTPIVCSVRLTIQDGSGAQVECGDAETSSFDAP